MQERQDFASWVEERLEERNLCGFGDPERHNLYPLDLELLVERADRVGLTPAEMRRQLPRLRGLDASL